MNDVDCWNVNVVLVTDRQKMETTFGKCSMFCMLSAEKVLRKFNVFQFFQNKINFCFPIPVSNPVFQSRFLAGTHFKVKSSLSRLFESISNVISITSVPCVCEAFIRRFVIEKKYEIGNNGMQ